jgi:hypothetical protein
MSQRVRTDKTPCEHNESGYPSIADMRADIDRRGFVPAADICHLLGLKAGKLYYMGPQFDIRANLMAENSEGLLPTGSTPNAARRSAIIESLVALLTCAAIRSTMVFGVPAEAIKPHHDMALNLGKSDSAMVGTLGARVERSSLDTASNRIAPFSAWDSASPNSANIARR